MTNEELLFSVESLEAHVANGRDPRAIEHLARELLLSQDCTSSDELHTRTLLALSHARSKQGAVADALAIAEQALALAQRTPNIELRAAAHSNLGLTYSAHADHETARLAFQESLQLFDQAGNMSGLARSMSYIGDSYLYSADYFVSLEHHNKALAIAQDLQDPTLTAMQFSKIALAYYYLGNFAAAIQHFQSAIAQYTLLDHKDGLLKTYGNLGNLFREIKDFDRSIEYLHASLTISTELGDRHSTAKSLCNIGCTYNDADDYDSAEKYLLEAVGIETELDDKTGQAINLVNLGNVMERRHDYVKALEYYFMALDIAIQIDQQHIIAILKGNAGSVYANTSFDGFDPYKGKQLLLEAEALNNALGTKANNIKVLLCLSELYEHLREWELFADAYKRHHALEKEVQSAEATHQAQLMEHRRRVEEAERDRQVKLARFQEQERIFHNILPVTIADRLIDGESTIAESVDSVSIFFSDIVGFTTLASQISATTLVEGLNQIFTEFDRLASHHGIERIKTIGDAYMAVCGVPEPRPDHALRVANFAIDVTRRISDFSLLKPHAPIQLRIGLHCGSVVAGVIGTQKFAYDLWGDAVNVASRMESTGEPGRIHVSEAFAIALTRLELETGATAGADVISDAPYHDFTLTERGSIDVKGKGAMTTFWLEGDRERSTHSRFTIDRTGDG